MKLKKAINVRELVLTTINFNNMYKLTLILFLFTVAYNLNGQEIISSSGGTYSNSVLSATFTVGECVTETFTGTNINLTQGFNQPSYSISTVKPEIKIDYTIEAFPNPVKDYIQISISKQTNKKLSYKLVDLNGKVLNSCNINAPTIQIPFLALPSSTYFLKVYEKNKEVKTFKIIKLK